MNKKRRKTTALVLQKKMTPEAAKEIIVETSREQFVAESVAINFLAYLQQVAKKQDFNVRTPGETVAKKRQEAFFAFEFETFSALGYTVDSDYAVLAKNFCELIIREYKCKTALEKSLAEVIASSFTKQLVYSMRIEKCFQVPNPENKIQLIAILNKMIDQTTRTYITAIETLKQLKNPSLNINVNAVTSFLAQNQQINVSGGSKDKNEKIIESK